MGTGLPLIFPAGLSRLRTSRAILEAKEFLAFLLLAFSDG